MCLFLPVPCTSPFQDVPFFRSLSLLLDSLSCRLVLSYLLKTSGTGGPSTSFPNMVDSCMTKVCITRSGAMVASQHLHCLPAYSLRRYLSPHWFSSPMVVVGTPNGLFLPETNLLGTLPSPDLFQPHMHKTPYHSVLGTGVEVGGRAVKGEPGWTPPFLALFQIG